MGVEDLLITDTGDAPLVAKKGETRKVKEKVKEVYKKLVEKGDEKAIVRTCAYRPLRAYTVIEEGH